MAKNPYQGDDVDPFSGARDEEGGIKRDSKEDSERDARESAVSGALKKSRPKPESKPKTAKGLDRPPTIAEVGKKKIPLKEKLAELREKGTTRERGSLKDLSTKMLRAPRLPGKSAEGQTSDIVGAKKGGMIKSSASKRADGCAVRGKTKGRMV